MIAGLDDLNWLLAVWLTVAGVVFLCFFLRARKPKAIRCRLPPVDGKIMPVNFYVLRKLNHDRIKFFGNGHTPAGLVACLAEEVGEVAECVLGLTGEKKRKASKTTQDLASELADVVTYVDLLADAYGIDLGEATRAKFNEVSQRVDYPTVW